MKVIFLDFDGVLNSVVFHKARLDAGLDMHVGPRGLEPCLDPKGIDVLNKTVGRTGAVTVVTSTWRKGGGRDGLVPNVRLREWMKKAGFYGTVLGATPNLGVRRGLEIQEWLDHDARMFQARFGPVTHFVILDDDTDMEHLSDKLVKIDNQEGLTAEYLPAILKHLEG